MQVRRGVDQLHDDPHAVTIHQHRPFEQLRHAQLAADFGTESSELTLRVGRARSNHQRRDPGQAGDQRVVDTRREIRVIRIRGEVLQWQDSDGVGVDFPGSRRLSGFGLDFDQALSHADHGGQYHQAQRGQDAVIDPRERTRTAAASSCAAGVRRMPEVVKSYFQLNNTAKGKPISAATHT